MKYPQLVSSRAVNEISEWLIKRLEDLDIEQPSAYSRLLLSLLHTPFKVNAIDLLELPQLKELKPNRLLKKDNEELKRLAAVECLMEVSAKQSKSNITNLVDELHSKLKKVETSCEENQIVGRASSVASSGDPVTSINSKLYKNLKKIKRNHAENPTKNYYLAFPALSSKKTNTTITYGGVKIPSSVEIAGSKKDSADLQMLCWSSLMSKDNSNPAAAECHTAEKFRDVRMKTPRKKRRYGRLQSLKGLNNSDVQCYAKTKDANNDIFSTSPKRGNSKKHQRNQYVTSKNQGKACGAARNSNYSNSVCPRMDSSSNLSAPWDMDFKGQWTMDRDLIGEFIEQQHDIFSNTSSNDSKSKVLMNEEDEVVLMKFLPITLTDQKSNGNSSFDKTFGENLQKTDEAQSISSLKSKFDANVKALWNDIDDSLTKPLSQKSFGFGDNPTFRTSYVSEKKSFSLFNFNGFKPESDENTADAALQMYDSFSTDFDYNNNKLNCHGAMNKSLPSTATSPGAEEKFIRSGTNLQASIWSNDEFAVEPEYNHHADHDVVIFKRMKSIGAEMKSLQMSAQDDEGIVSLFNHSDLSAFKRVRPPIASTIIRANYHPFNTPQIERPLVDLPEDEDNLLTSELTHFSPIIRDGHTFVIDNHWDEIKWERSSSGNLMYSDNRYLEWNQSFSRTSENYFQRNKNIDVEAMEQDSTDFTIKFMVINENDKGCQTDFNDSLKQGNRDFVEINEEYCKQKIYDEYFKGIGEMNNQWRCINSMEDSNDYSFFSVNRIKNNTTTTVLQDILVSSNSSSSSICTITSSSQDALASDPFESWRSFKVHGGIIERDAKNACMHSLWDSCTTCTRNDSNRTEEKSIPANRLLKDELRMDGDEIMNVIQNLYITGDYCEDDEKDGGDECEDMNHFYMDMLDDSIDGSGCAVEESKFYDMDDKKKETCEKDKVFTPRIFERHQCEENFDDFTLAKMQWQWDKRRETEKDQEKYLKLLKWIQSSLLKENFSDFNNNFQLTNDEQRSKNRKRRHSTCQNFMENKTTSWSQDHELTYPLNLCRSPTIASYVEETANMFKDASKILKVNMEKIMLIADSSDKTEIRHGKAENGANYYRNILQQQHALIKQMDLARPLTR